MSLLPSPSKKENSAEFPMELVPVNNSTQPAEKCAICGKPAFCYHYGVLTCNACKMFFRRIEVEKITYKCKYRDRCHLDMNVLGFNAILQCKACRFKKCLQAGMKYIQPGKIENIELDQKFLKKDNLSSVISFLMFLETRRRHRLMNFFCLEDPSLVEVVEGKKWAKLVVKDMHYQNTIHEWSVLSIHTTIEFFMSLEIMSKLENKDKTVLLQSFSLKSMLFAGGKRALEDMRDRVLTPDHKDVYPDTLYRLAHISGNFLNQIRSKLTSRLTELGITQEEYVLINVILFSNSTLTGLSETSRPIISTYQQTYSNYLRQYCQTKYQKNWPTRFTDLLSLIHVINKTFEDVLYLTMLCQYSMPTMKLKKLYTDLLKSPD